MAFEGMEETWEEVEERLYKTAQQWSSQGYSIRKGQKSHRRNSEGVCVFHPNQVVHKSCFYKPKRRSPMKGL